MWSRPRRCLVLLLSLLLLGIAALAPGVAQAADLTFSPGDPFAFSDTTVGSVNQGNLLVKNSSDGPVDIFGVALAGPDADQFTIDANGCPLLLVPDDSCQIAVSLRPTRAGAAHAQLVVSDDGLTQPLVQELSGTAVSAQLALSPTAYDFGLRSVDQGEQSTTVNVQNAGSATVLLGAATLEGAGSSGYRIDGDGCNGQLLAPGQGCNVQVGFDPTDALTYDAALRLHAGDADATVSLTGVGGVQRIVATPDSVDFGGVDVGGSATRSIAIENTGNLPFQAIVAIPTGGDVGAFRVIADGCSLRRIDPGNGCTLTVRFTPLGPGAAMATLALLGDNVPTIVTLRGSGRQPAGAPPADPPASAAGVAFDWNRLVPAPFARGRVDLGVVRCAAPAQDCMVTVHARVYASSVEGTIASAVAPVLTWRPGAGARASLALPRGLGSGPAFVVAHLSTSAPGRATSTRTLVVALVRGRRLGSLVAATPMRRQRGSSIAVGTLWCALPVGSCSVRVALQRAATPHVRLLVLHVRLAAGGRQRLVLRRPPGVAARYVVVTRTPGGTSRALIALRAG